MQISDREVCTLCAKELNFSDYCLYKYLYNRRRKRKFQIDLRDFNKWYKRNNPYGKEFSRRTLRRLMVRLVELGLIKSVKSGFWYTFEVVVLPVSVLFGSNGQPGANQTDMPKSKNSNPSEIKHQQKIAIRQQQLIPIAKQMCESVGIYYREEKVLNELVSKGLKVLDEVIAHFVQRNSTKTIVNPAGWLRECVRRDFYLDKAITPMDELREIQSLETQYFAIRNRLLDLVGTLPVESYSNAIV